MANIKKPENPLNLDANTLKNFIKFLRTLGQKPSTTVRFFDRGDYYTVHGADDTELISKMVYSSVGQIKIMAPGEVEEVPYVTINKANFEMAMRQLLLVKNYRVEIYNNKKGSGPNDWKVEFRGSPGNLVQFEDILFGNNDMVVGTAVIAIQIKSEGTHKLIGLTCVETNDCLMSVTEFLDDDYFTELEATTVLLGPKECLLPASDGDFAGIKSLMERNGVLVSTRKKGDFNLEKSDLIQDLNKLIRFEKGQQEDANSLPELNKKIAVSALGAAIKYLDLVNDAACLGSFELKQLNLNRFVHLDPAAVAALNLLPKPGVQPNSPSYRWQSVLGVLDRCRTPQGHRLMSQWVKQPLRNEATLKDRHDIVQCLLDSPQTLTDLHDDFLKRIPDILMLTKKLLRKKGSLQDLFRLYQVIIRTPKLVTALMSLENPVVNSVICDSFKDTLDDLKMLKQMVEQVIDLEGVQKGEFFVKASFDDDLEEMKDKMDHLLERMQSFLNKAADDLQLERASSIKLEHVSHLGYHFRISLKDDAVLRKNPKYKILDAIKGGVRFTTDKLSETNESFRDIKEQYEEQQKSIVDEVIRVAVGYLIPLTSLNGQIARVDCLVSYAIAARSAPIPYVRPKILPEGAGVLELKNVRHPCLELQENVTYIANDVNFKKDETHMYIITGPNMGGKSTYIRSVGTAVLMAQVGAFVPCDEATISMVDSILGRIGASDNIVKGLSTFMVEMIDTAGIIRAATEKSVVIIDELGRGTSTYEGCGIAWSIAEHLARETKCFTLFATHFHEITELSENVRTVKNCHMAAVADDANFTLLYQVKPGVMDKSFGIHVARLANFPESVVKMAQTMYEEFEDMYTDLKTSKDREVICNIEKSIEKFADLDISDDQVEAFIKNVRQEAGSVDSAYLKAAYPSLFQ